MAMDQPHPVDSHVGERLRYLRVKARLSQQAVAKLLGLTFQQVQKYEKGTNRISASKLYQLSRILSCQVQDFFAGLQENNARPASIVASSRLDYEILNLLHGLTDARIKRQIRALLDAVIEAPTEALGGVAALSAPPA